ncbi:MAG: PucR family transcriptional regulator [Eubacteriaceae bacterium]
MEIGKYNVLNMKEKLYKAMTSGKGLQQILDEASVLFKNPIMLYDTTLRNIATAQYGVYDDPLMNTILQDGYIPVTNFELAQRNGLVSQVLKGEKISRIYKLDFLENRFISSQFEIDGKVSGFLDVIEWCSHFEEEALELHETLREIIEYVIVKDPSFHYAKGDSKEYFLLHLLQTNEIDLEIITQRSKLLDFPEGRNWLVVIAQYTGNENLYLPAPYIKKNLNLSMYNSISTVYDDRVVYILPIDKEKSYYISDLKKMIPNLIQKRKISIGFSSCINHISVIKEGYIEAKKAIELGIKLSDNNIYIYDYDNYRYYHGLDIISEHYNLEKFCDSRLLGLLKYDSEYKTEYVNTIRCYLDMGCSIPLTAKKQNVHRNTIDYRIKKIQELQNINLNNTNDIFSMKYSFQILIYLDKKF